MLGASEYNDATKETWRGWKWNAIARACAGDRVPPSEARRRLGHKTVLYLVGPEDRDRQKAITRGFSNTNLFAVDIDADRVRAVRRDGNLALCGSIQQVVANWGESVPIDVVDCDFCHGVTADVEHFTGVLLSSPAIHRGTVLSMNFLRGRDDYTNFIRRNLGRGEGWASLDRYHRGVNWLYLWAHIYSSIVNRSARGPAGEVPMNFADYLWVSGGAMLNSYRSKISGQYFDSVVHNVPFLMEFRCDRDRDMVKTADIAHMSRRAKRDPNTAGKVAALKAVRTVRQRQAC